jgi:hypothetical protein
MGYALAVGRGGLASGAFAVLLPYASAFGGIVLHSPALGLRGLAIFHPVRLADALLAFLALRSLHSVLALGRLSRFTRVAAALCLRLARAMLLLAALAGLLFLSLRLVGPRLALTLVVLHSGVAFALPHLGPALILPGCWSFIAALLRVSAHFSALPRALFACA